MKYWNKSKKYRELSWTKVEGLSLYTEPYWFAPNGIRESKLIDEKAAKLWCQQQPGRDRFYFGPYTGIWYFESSEDALAFKLKWIGPN